MKKIAILALVLSLLGVGYLALAHFSGGAFPTGPIAVGGDEGIVRRTATSFMEDIQFKDFDKAASYHTEEDQDTVDIPYLIWRMFKVKPEALDIMSHEIVFSKLDSTGLRARVKVRCKVKELIDERMRDQEMILYFHRDDTASPWFMRLEDSLRTIENDKKKKT